MKPLEFETYEEYLDEHMCGGGHIEEAYTKEEFYKEKNERVCSNCGKYIIGLALLSPALDEKRRCQCKECGMTWIKEQSENAAFNIDEFLKKVDRK
jgi:DNA-directed RNA polymerase subunit RPC12/RpoP